MVNICIPRPHPLRQTVLAISTEAMSLITNRLTISKEAMSRMSFITYNFSHFYSDHIP